MVARLWLAALLPPPGLEQLPREGTAVAMRTCPLNGMPSWSPLKLHVAICCGETIYEFVPHDATAPATIARLLTGSSVSASVRRRRRGSGPPTRPWRRLGTTLRTEEELNEWADRYQASLSLRTNNCWTFASAMASFTLQDVT
jgi:hypothetical protein